MSENVDLNACLMFASDIFGLFNEASFKNVFSSRYGFRKEGSFLTLRLFWIRSRRNGSLYFATKVDFLLISIEFPSILSNSKAKSGLKEPK